MAIKHNEEFKQEAVRIALTSRLPRASVAADLGVGTSMLGKWVSDYRPTDLVSALAKQIWRVRMNVCALRTAS